MDSTQLVVVDPGCYIDRIEIARGGMGRISAARDHRLGRKIALKELCVDQPETRARLAREALLTARLSHPSIVSVHEAGQWPNGRPFIAMKLVPGRSLDRVIGDHPTLAGRLALLPHILAVADALAYAHQHRVIHRDLKPHNVLVGEFGETVVIDWGLAKDLGAGDRDEPSGPHATVDASATIDGDVMGTPAYMPPEQAAGEPVDERADVYAIGAMLYHLLAGHAPYGPMAGAAIVEVLQDEPPPSVRESAPEAPADLLAIVDRAMARDPDDRYPTALGLAEDLRRFHAGQLVGAHRYSWRELARRWLRRNRRTVGVAAVSLVVLIAFGLVTLARIVRAEHHAQAERVKAERHRADAEELLEFMLGDLREKLRPVNQLGLLESVAHKARDYFENRPDDLDPESLRKHASSLIDLGDVLFANGHSAEALAEYERALQVARGLVLLSPEEPKLRNVLAVALTKSGELIRMRGDVERAMLQYRQALSMAPRELRYLRDLAFTHAQLGIALQRSNDPSAALEQFRIEVALRHAVSTTAPTDTALLREIASAHMRVGNIHKLQGASTSALAEYRTALGILENIAAKEPGNALFQRELATAHERLGSAIDRKARYADALAEHRISLAIRVRLAAADPTNIEIQRSLSVSHLKIADLLGVAEDFHGALVHYRADAEITERLAAGDPGNLDKQRDLLVTEHRMGALLVAQDKAAEAVESYRRSVTRAEWIAAQDRTLLRSWHDVALSHRRLGDAMMETGDKRGALLEYRIYLAHVGSIVARAPTNIEWQKDLSDAHEVVATTLIALGHRPEAIQQLHHDLELATRVSVRDPRNVDWARDLAAAQSLLAMTNVQK